MTTPEAFTKSPAETYTIAIEYSGRLPTGAALISGTVSAINEETKELDNSVLNSTTATISGTQARARVQAGTHGKRYRIVFSTTITGGEILEDIARMEVIDAAKV